jgi:hypothetical protein
MEDLYATHVARRFKHPWLVLLAVAGVVLHLLGAVLGVVGSGIFSGFLGVYGIILLTVTAFGYVSLFTMKAVTRRRSGV